MKNTMLLVFCLSAAVQIYAQENQLLPVFPETNPNIIFIEGESAVSTNFAVEPTWNYHASGSRTLQLNRAVGLQGASQFFAEYVFYVEKEGEFELWYGGTPPGPKDDLYPSYTSPFTYGLDGGEQQPVYRETVSVHERYLPVLYWCRVDSVHLEKGVHKIRLQVSEKRKYDGRYLFYLDNLFFIRTEAKESPGKPLPNVFPEKLTTEETINFSTISAYEQDAQANQDDPEKQKSLSLMYTLLGDYNNALKAVKRAQLLEPDNNSYMVLAAKERIWKGDINEGLSLYKQAAEKNPGDAGLWAEAGKIAAWTGKYQESINFYTEGLKTHPDNINLAVNLGITYLWMSNDKEAARYFEKAYSLARDDLSKIKELASVFIINGYTERAENIYNLGIKTFPDQLDLYLQLEDLYTSQGKDREARQVLGTITETFQPSEALSSYIETFQIKVNLRNQVIEGYRQQVAENPDNIDLRDQLVQTYFWNGRREEAIKEYLNILVNYAYKSFVQMDNTSMELLEQLDRTYLYYHYFKRISGALPENKKKLLELYSAYNAARKKYDRDKAGGGEKAASAKDAFLQAQKALAEFTAGETNNNDMMMTRKLQYQELQSSNDRFREAGEKEGENFRKVIEPLKWEWDRDFFVQEFEQVFQNEPVLAGHVLGRLYQFEGKLPSAAQLFSLSAGEEKPQPATVYALAEDYLWTGEWDKLDKIHAEYKEQINGYAAYQQDVYRLVQELSQPAAADIISPSAYDRIAENTQSLIEQYSEVKQQTDTLLQNIQNDIAVLSSLLYEKMKRTFYTLESNTYLIRNELGKYYLTENDLVSATKQFEKVLDIDPWNIDVKFNLGVVRQKYGDWHKAMKIFKEVYYADPSYPNGAAYYNLLARQYPDILNADTTLLGDTSRISFEGKIGFSTALSSIMSWTGSYTFNNVRLYKPSGTESPSSHQTHTIAVGVPVDLYFINLTLSPTAGVLLSSDLFQDNALSTSAQVLTPGYFLFMSTLFPVLGGNIIFEIPNLQITGSYMWQPVPDTLIPGRDPLTEHLAELTVNTSLAGLEAPILKLTSIRGYGKLEFVEDANIIGTALEEFSFGIHLADSPWANLFITETLSFEHSSTPSDLSNNGYYAPNSVLVFKGGVSGSAWFSLMNENSLGVQLTALTGGYWERLAEEVPDPAGLQVELVGHFELSKGTSSYYTRIYGSRTWVPSSGKILYWSLTLSFGINARIPKLLAP